MLYSASQLIGKTMVLEKPCNIYRVYDVNQYGDLATPVSVMGRNGTFIIDSFLEQTSGYTNQYGIVYAKRTVPYFTFFGGGDYLAIAVIGDGRFSIAALRDQGALSVKEEAAKDARDSNSALQNFLNDLSAPIKILLLVGAGAIVYSATKKR